jgi:hypothetical protein
VEWIEVSLIEVVFDIFEKLILRCDLVMPLDVVDHLDEVMRDALEVDVAWDWCPPKVEVTHLGILKLNPEVRPGFLHDSFDEGSVVATEDLVFELTASLCIWWLEVKVRGNVLI